MLMNPVYKDWGYEAIIIIISVTSVTPATSVMSVTSVTSAMSVICLSVCFLVKPL